MFSRLSSLMLCVVLIFTIGACKKDTTVTSSNIDTVSVVSEESTIETAEIANYTRLIGRVIKNIREDAISVSWTNSGIEFTFEGTTASIKMKADEIYGLSSEILMGVFIDGEIKHSSTFIADTKIKEYVLASELELGIHTIKLLKLSEASIGSALLMEVITDGEEIKPTEPKTRYIEFIGDSITCGFGTLAPNSIAPFNPTEEDGSLTYGYLTAANLDAESSFVSVSGIGMYVNGNGSTTGTMSSLYDYANLQLEMLYKLPEFTKWINKDKEKEPDAVVINLGTNDEGIVMGDTEETENFSQSYIKFLKQVRANNPNAEIFVTYGTMRYQLSKPISEAVKAYSLETGDEKVYFYSYVYYNSAISNGTLAGHPSPKAHIKMAKDLTAQIKKVMKW